VRHTKIIATLGPASSDPATIDALIAAGADVFRFNFSHGTQAEHAARFRMVHEAAARAGRHIPVLQDLSGPKIRTGRLEGGQPIALLAGQPLIIEIGTGSGCIAVALAKELPGARLIATDVSRRALRLAEANAARHGAGNIRFLAGDLFGALRGLGLEGRADLVVSNPPYVVEKEWEDLAPEVRDHEPRRALVSGPTGLETIRRLARGAGRYLAPGGLILLEFGHGQATEVLRLFAKDWKKTETIKDLAGHRRVLAATR